MYVETYMQGVKLALAQSPIASKSELGDQNFSLLSPSWRLALAIFPKMLRRRK